MNIWYKKKKRDNEGKGKSYRGLFLSAKKKKKSRKEIILEEIKCQLTQRFNFARNKMYGNK